MRLAPLLAALLCAAPAGASSPDAGPAPAAAAAPAAAPTLRFAWGAPVRVAVTERSLKKGRRAVTRYDAVLTARKGGGYALNLEKFAFVELDGAPVDRKALPPELRAAEALASATPTLLLSADGELEDVTGWEQMMRRVLAMVPAEGGMREQVGAMLAQPQMQQMMRQKSGDFWSAWVSAWHDTDLAPGEERSGTVPMELPGGPVDSAVTMRHRGADAAHPGAVKLEVETVLEGEPFRKGMATMLQQMLAAAPRKDGQAPPDLDTMLESARRVTTLTVVTDPATLRPYSAETLSVTALRVQGQARDEREEHAYTFAWPETKGAGKKRR